MIGRGSRPPWPAHGALPSWPCEPSNDHVPRALTRPLSQDVLEADGNAPERMAGLCAGRHLAHVLPGEGWPSCQCSREVHFACFCLSHRVSSHPAFVQNLAVLGVASGRACPRVAPFCSLCPSNPTSSWDMAVPHRPIGIALRSARPLRYGEVLVAACLRAAWACTGWVGDGWPGGTPRTISMRNVHAQTMQILHGCTVGAYRIPGELGF
jgi:hypothetical protein